MFGLVDGNNFYASCERVFNPALLRQPVCVLSNNDGCAIARSQECKELGVKMGQPIHEVPPHILRQIRVLSANFALYGDLSGRVVSVLQATFSRVEVYSIDESFVNFDGVPDVEREDVARRVRAQILQWVGIPCCVGIGPTKTLAKLANKLAKKTSHGVITTLPGSTALESFAIEDVWGVGRKLTARLGAEGILTAADLIRADPGTIRARYGVTLARTQRELQGFPCTDIEEHEADRKQIVVSRSFGSELVSLDDLQQAVSTFAQRACEKLRARSLKAGGVWIWLSTNPFKTGAAQYHPSKTFNFVSPTSDTREVLSVAQGLTKAMWKRGYSFKKAGVGLLNLKRSDSHQGDLFTGIDPRSQALMEVMDRANAKFGRGALALASSAKLVKAAGPQRPSWAMNQKNLSPAYTTDWSQLVKVR